MKKIFATALIAAAVSFGFVSQGAAASLVAHVDIGAQRMTVTESGRVVASWPVSTGRKGFATPSGSYKPTRMHRMWYSKKYDNSPMPYSVFFRGGYAIHGTGYVKQLGRPASHGCVRLATGNAAAFYSLVKQHGAKNTRIVLVN
ncbi:murein L,D-transpeptidase [Salmonella enterica subsp. enterica]|nr:murein L,D-transpeptidase [Salmonella enterica subsp. enterica serovar Enteritidis]